MRFRLPVYVRVPLGYSVGTALRGMQLRMRIKDGVIMDGHAVHYDTIFQVILKIVLVLHFICEIYQLKII